MKRECCLYRICAPAYAMWTWSPIASPHYHFYTHNVIAGVRIIYLYSSNAETNVSAIFAQNMFISSAAIFFFRCKVENVKLVLAVFREERHVLAAHNLQLTFVLCENGNDIISLLIYVWFVCSEMIVFDSWIVSRRFVALGFLFRQYL